MSPELRERVRLILADAVVTRTRPEKALDRGMAAQTARKAS